MFRTYLQSVPIHLLSFSTSHFLNCFLTIISSPTSDYTFDEFSSSTSTSTNTSANSSVANTNNSSAQKTTNKKKNKKQQQQQRKHSPIMRNGRGFLKKKMNFFFVLFLESLEFSMLTSKLLWSQLTNEAKARYNFDLNW